MYTLINQLFSSIIQIILFTLIPFILWKITRQKEKFLYWIGLKKFYPLSKRAVLLSVFAFLLFSIVGFYSLKSIPDTSILANAKFKNFSVVTVISIILYSFFQTGLAEEIFFRGFLTKRLINKFGFSSGNFIQAIIFGAVHGFLFLQQNQEVLSLFIIVLLTSFIGFIIGYINEKLAHGSIVIGWILHSLGNLLSTILLISGIV